MKRLVRAIADCQSLRDDLSAPAWISPTESIVILWLNLIISTLRQIETVLPTVRTGNERVQSGGRSDRVDAMIEQINTEIREDEAPA